ncbi:hypothetical protein TRIUR3_22885 [Triticum urartu]|uniref:Uncharacterized protein n=2 Tax=Triticum TaxID=4564 RepID=A0A9R0UUU7_TRITD|nr:uncharacterized protein LOC125508526 [Triticum urartu]EMS67557.1 hypothetical protein TRIUR3_22885 [Triticum urartu]VAH04054.1 unnamed protein product [Triticum turgidum subsp. durum]
MSKPPPPPPTPPASEASSSVAAAAPRSLPPTLLLPPSSSGNRGARGGSAAGSRKGKAPVGSAAGAQGERHQHDPLVEAVRLVGRDVDPGVAGADILELAMAKGPMFSWLRYWPEEGYPEEGRPY